jgi:hypothetical protein
MKHIKKVSRVPAFAADWERVAIVAIIAGSVKAVVSAVSSLAFGRYDA